MTSPTNNQPTNPDLRWEQARAERKAGDKHDSKSRQSAYHVLDAIPNKQIGTIVEETSKSFKELDKSRKHYSTVNKLENGALRDRRKEHKCIIL